MDAPQNDNGGKETQLLPNWAASLMNSSYFDYGSEANGDCPTEADGHATPSSLSESEDDDMSDFSSLRTIDSVSSNDIPNGGDCCVVNIDTPAFNPGQHEQEREKEEELRLSALKSYEILNSLNHCNVQTSLDRITSLTSRILRVPIACITLVDSDQIYFISKKGLNSRVSSMESWKCIQQIPRLNGFCSYTIQCKDDFFVVPDAMTDQRFAHRSTLTLDFPQARFYAGTPLKCPETGCNLELAAMAAEALVEWRDSIRQRLDNRNKLLACAAHDLLMPLNGMHSSLHALKKDLEQNQQTQNDGATEAEAVAVAEGSADVLRKGMELVNTAHGCAQLVGDICQSTLEDFSTLDSFSELSVCKETEQEVGATARPQQSERNHLMNSEAMIHHQGNLLAVYNSAYLHWKSKDIRANVVISEFVHRIKSAMASYPKSVPLLVHAEASVPSTVCVLDEQLVYRTAINYLTNACRHTKKGWIRLHISIETTGNDDGVQDKSKPAKRVLTFVCEDTGPGVKETAVANLFQLSAQKPCKNSDLEGSGVAAHARSGLGLLSVANSVACLQGKYGYYPRMRYSKDLREISGSIFWFSVPFVSQEDVLLPSRNGTSNARKRQGVEGMLPGSFAKRVSV